MRLPVTGASSNSRPCCAASPASSAIHAGLTVLDSMRIASEPAAASAPSLPSQTAREAASSASMLMMIEAPFAASAGVDARRAPASTNACAFAAVRLYTTTENPAFSRFAAMPPPIVPSPSIATVSAMKSSSSFALRRASALRSSGSHPLVLRGSGYAAPARSPRTVPASSLHPGVQCRR